jgi:hypothetical protein
MSLYALQSAIADRIQTLLSKGDYNVVAQDWPEPPSGWLGRLFVAVHPGPTTGAGFGDRGTGHDENYSIQITVSQKTGWLPADRRGPVTSLSPGEHCSRVMMRIYRDLALLSTCTSVITAANALLATDEGGGRTSQIECARFKLVMASENRRKFGYWFGFNMESAQEFTGVASTAMLTGAVRRMDVRVMT